MVAHTGDIKAARPIGGTSILGPDSVIEDAAREDAERLGSIASVRPPDTQAVTAPPIVTADTSAQVGGTPPSATEPPAPAAVTATATIRHTQDGKIILHSGMGYEEDPAVREQVQEAVKQWQQDLKDKGLYTGEIDGKFGPLTDAATRDYQKRYGLGKADGIVGAETWKDYEIHKGQTISAQELPPQPDTPAAAPDVPLAATQIVHGTPEQREASLKQLQAEIDAEFDKRNHTIDSSGTHHYSWSWVASKFTGTPQVPPALIEAFKQGNDPRISITDDNGNVIPGKEAVSVFDDHGNLTADAKQAMLKGAFNGKLETAGKEVEGKLAQHDANAPTVQSRLSDVDLLAQGHGEERGELMMQIGRKLREENPNKDIKIEVPTALFEEIKEKGVAAYGNGQSIDFRVDPNSTVAQQVAKMKAEMQEFAGLISGGKHIENLDDTRVQNGVVTPLGANLDRESQAR
ncbi:MAG: peptidoglycan-binding domain-containing protein [Rickettsiales bacterium]